MTLLHLYPETLNLVLVPLNSWILHHCKLIVWKWKQSELSTISNWIRKLTHCMVMERIIYFLETKMDAYKDIWRPFADFLKKSCITIYSGT